MVASTGVSMYLTREAIAATLRQVAAFAPGSTFAMSFMLPIELTDPEIRPGVERAAAALAERYFAGRTDGLRPPNNSEELLVATT